MPNAGLPMRVEGRNIYLCSPEYMAQYARRLLWAGVRIIGGCCGTTPDHIKLIRSETRSLQPLQKKLSVTVEEPEAKPHALPPVPHGRQIQAGRQAGRGQVRRLRGDSAAARRGRLPRNRRRPPLRRARHRLHQRARRAARQRPHERPGHLPAHPAGGRNRSRQPLLLPRPQHPRHPVRAAGRAHRGGAQPHLHHRRSAAHGRVSRRHRGVRRGCHRAGQHRPQPEPRAGYRRQPHGFADGAADRRGRQPRRAQYGRRDPPLRMEGGGRRRVRGHPAGVRPGPAGEVPASASSTSRSR